MTTIVYNHKEKVIACDGRVTKGDTILDDNCEKTYKRDGLVFVGAGEVHDINLLVDGYPDRLMYEGTLNACMFVVDGGKVFEVVFVDGAFNIAELSFSATIGSGSHFALAALDFGCTAKDAVKYAMTRDLCTGGKIKTIKVK